MSSSKTVSFTQMKDGTRQDYAMLAEMEHAYIEGTATRLLAELKRQGDETIEGYKITRLDHALQSATRAHRDGADIDWVVSTLLHDIGDGLAPTNHDKFAAAILKPYVREECAWVVEHHGTFQMIYYMHHYGGDPNQREQFKDHPSYQTCIDFCERWDQSSFDPDYPQEKLTFFEPMVREVFARKPHNETTIKPNIALGLPEAG
ncbi:MAG: HD domain-containing protein [Rhizobiaceae bacterium]